MKPFFLLILLSFGLLACHKTYNHQFKVEGEILGWPDWYTKTLVITSPDGTILHTREIEAYDKEFRFVFSQETDDKKADFFDAHIVITADIDTCNKVYVFSQFDIPNGDAFALGSKSAAVTSDRKLTVIVHGINSFQGITKADLYRDTNSVKTFNGVSKTLKFQFFAKENHGVVLKMKANGENNFRSLFIPAEKFAQSDTAEFNWEDFGPESDNIKVEVEDKTALQNFELAVINPDTKSTVTIDEERAWGAAFFFPFITYPHGMPDDALLLMRAKREFYTCEKLFSPDESVVVSASEMKINTSQMSAKYVHVIAEGSPDWVVLESSISTFGKCDLVAWTLEGPPESFKERLLPDLSTYFPANFDLQNSNILKKSRIMNFDRLNQNQIRVGYPYRQSDAFGLAKSGYTEVWRNF